MALAPGKGTSSSAASRGLSPQEEAGRLLKFNQPPLRSEASPAAGISSSGRASVAKTLPPASSDPSSKEVARLSQLIKDRRRIPDTFSSGPERSDGDFEPSGDLDGADGGDEQLSDSSMPEEQMSSVTDVGQLGNPFAEDVSMEKKMREANQRQAQALGQPSGPGAKQNPIATQNTGIPGSSSEGKRGGSIIERGREALGQEYGKFQRDLQATKRKNDEENKSKLKALANKPTQTLQNINMLKERYEKIRDLFSIGTGIGLVYYIAKLDITIVNRYLLKRTYLWGYRDEREYEGNRMLRMNDLLDGLEWSVWFMIRVIIITAPIMVLFTWVILPGLLAHEAATRILGPVLAGYLSRLIH